MEYDFENMNVYINMWRAVMVNDVMDDFTDPADEETKLNVQCALEYVIASIDRGLDAWRHGFRLGGYKDECGSPMEVLFSRWHYIGSSVEK